MKQRQTDNQLIGRQGDVGFVTAAIPPDAKRIPLRPFALGETTGHAHRVIPEHEIFVEMYEKDGLTYVRVSGECDGVRIQHEDHDPDASVSVLPAGWEGKVPIAREYDEEEDFRIVTD